MAQFALSLEEAWERLESQSVSQPESLLMPVTESVGYVLAESVSANVDSPPADNSAMDGIAVNTSSVDIDQPVPVSQRIAAGQVPLPLADGSAARIFTGAEIPAGADCVVIQENCDFIDQQVVIKEGLKPGANIRRRASDIASGDLVMAEHRRIRPQEVGLLLSCGISTVRVYRPLRVGVIATGDELVDLDTLEGELPKGKIFESNSPMIAARLSAMNCVANRYRAPDNLSETVRVLREALAENDAVLTIGGVSVGEEDHVQSALADIGRLDFWKILIKPGKPFLLGEALGKPVMGLPGNPVSSFVTFTLFCAPFLGKLQGLEFARPTRLPAVAGFDSARVSDRVDHLRGRIVSRFPQLVVEPVGLQSSSIQGALCAADVLIVVPADTAVERGQPLKVIPL